MIQSSAQRLPKIRSKADLQVQPMKFCFVRTAVVQQTQFQRQLQRGIGQNPTFVSPA